MGRDRQYRACRCRCRAGQHIPLFILAAAVAAGSWLLVWHYNERMTGARNDAVTLVERLKSYDIDYDALLKTDVESAYSAGQNYDRQELTTFAWVLGLSPFLVLLVRLASFLR
jgi:hypothetical protein